MSLKNCPLSEICVMYKSGGRKPPNNDVRNKIPCKSFLDVSCEMGMSLELWLAGPNGISCDIEKVKRLRRGNAAT